MISSPVHKTGGHLGGMEEISDILIETSIADISEVKMIARGLILLATNCYK